MRLGPSSRTVVAPQVPTPLVGVANADALPPTTPAEIVRQLLPVVLRLRLDYGLEIRLHDDLLEFFSCVFDTARLRRPDT
jgi:hypothetical protein